MAAPIVAVQAGKIRGKALDGAVAFLGVPYAAAPVGERTFAPPQPHEPWDDERDCTEYGPTAPYRSRTFPGLDLYALVGDGWKAGDDYLNLNIWTPDVAARGLPVLVFIHGGAFVGGCNRAPVQDGTAFARSGVVCVTINYRLGVNGFMPIPGAPTNLGLRDQIAALEWVRDNIAAFGGDPDKVTVAGESAGAMSVADLMTSPLAIGLFRRAIIESGHGGMVRPKAIGERVTQKLAQILGVAPTVQGFSSVSAETWLEGVAKLQLPTTKLDLKDASGRDASYGLSRFLPVTGDDVLPTPPIEALASGAGAQVDLLIGACDEEMRLYFVPTGVMQRVNAILAWLMLRRLEPGAWGVLKAYGMGKVPAAEALSRALTDLVFRKPALQFAAAHQGRTHVYSFGWKSPACGGQLGACHGLELPFVFNTLATCTGPEGAAGPNPPQELADRIHGLWVGFIRDGWLPWEPYGAETRQVHALERDEAATRASINVR